MKISRLIKKSLPFLILLGGIAGTAALFSMKPEPKKAEVPEKVLSVRVKEVQPTRETLIVRTQGTVSAHSETRLVSEVAGKVAELNPSFFPGGFFQAGEWMIRLEDTDARAMLAQREAEVAQNRLALALEEARADRARQEWLSLGEGEASPLTMREPQLQEARMRLLASEAALANARQDLDRTEIKAPFNGILREKMVDMGEFVSPGMAVGMLFSTDFAEVRLPLSPEDFRFLEGSRSSESPDRFAGVPVTLKGLSFGEQARWEAELVRGEGTVDPLSRVMYLVARVQDPYNLEGHTNRPVLPLGTFVEAEIQGRTLENVVVIPRHVLRINNEVLVVDEDDRLHARPVEVLRAESSWAFIGEGLEAGDRISLTSVEFLVDGMKVRPVDENGVASVSEEKDADPETDPATGS